MRSKTLANPFLVDLATTLNYRDLVIANGGYPFPVKDDVVPLSDAAGTIDQIGSDVSGFEKGEHLVRMPLEQT